MSYVIAVELLKTGYLQALDFTLPEDIEEDEGFSEELLAKAKDDCEKFFHACEDFGEATLDQVGMDFWYTRNGHGVGFWDRPELYGIDNAEKLSEIARGFGECNVYVGDDKLLYIM